MSPEPSQPAEVMAALCAEAQRIEEEALQASRRHFAAARNWSRWHFAVGLPTALLAAVASALAYAEQTVWAASLAALVAATAALNTFLNARDRAAAHHSAASAYKALSDDARIFRQIDCRQANPEEDLAAKLRRLAAAHAELNSASPLTPRFACHYPSKTPFPGS